MRQPNTRLKRIASSSRKQGVPAGNGPVAQDTSRPKPAKKVRRRRYTPVDQDGVKLRPLDLVRASMSDHEPKYRNLYPFTDGDVPLFMGDVNQMPGHCVVIDKAGRTWWG